MGRRHLLGKFSGTFKDYQAQSSTFTFPVTVHVQKRAGLTEEEKQQVNSSDFRVNITAIYHTMQKGQIIDSDHTLPSGNGLNGISTTEYARITEDAVLSEKSETTQKTGLVIGLFALGITLVGGGYVFWKKKKELGD